MNEKLQETCEEIFRNETESKKFMKLSTPEEIYAYFKTKIPELTEEEFDDFISKILNSYSDMQENEPELLSSALESVAGGASFGKFSKQMVSGAMALLSLAPATMATNARPARVGGSSSQIAEEYTIKRKGTFSKIKDWIKEHKLLIVGGTLALVVAGSWAAYRYYFGQEKEPEPEFEQRLVDIARKIFNNLKVSKKDLFEKINNFRTDNEKKMKKLPDKINDLIQKYGSRSYNVNVKVGEDDGKFEIIIYGEEKYEAHYSYKPVEKPSEKNRFIRKDSKDILRSILDNLKNGKPLPGNNQNLKKENEQVMAYKKELEDAINADENMKNLSEEDKKTVMKILERMCDQLKIVTVAVGSFESLEKVLNDLIDNYKEED